MLAQTIDFEAIDRQRVSDQRILEELRVKLEELDPEARISLPEDAIEALDRCFAAASRNPAPAVVLAAGPFLPA